MADKQVNIKINVDGKDAEKGVKQVQGSITGMKNNAGSAFDFMKSKWLAVSAGIAAGAVVLKKALDFAEVFSDFKEQADLLASNFGISSDKLIARVRAATNGMVSNIEIVKNATKAFALGSAQNIDDVAKMFQIAEVQGKMSGKSMEEAFNIITEAVGRGRPGMLSQIGFSKDIIQSWENQAVATGGVLDSQTLLNKVMEVGAKNLEKASAAGLSFGDKLKILKSAADNVKLAIGEGVIRSLDPIIDKIKDFASSETSLKRVKDAVLVLTTAIQIWVDVLRLGVQAFQAFISPIVGFGKAVFDIFEKIKSGKATLQDLFNLDFLKNELKVAGKEITDSAEGIKNTIVGIGDKTKNAFNGITSPTEPSAGGTTSTGSKNKEKSAERIQQEKEFQEKFDALVTNHEKSTLQTRLDALNKLAESKLATEKHLTAIETEQSAVRKQIAQEEMQVKLQSVSAGIQTAQQLEQGFSDLFAGLSSNRMKEFENEQIQRTNVLDEQLKLKLIDDEEYAIRKKAIDKDIAVKKATEERKLAEIQKGLRITEIILNTASAVVSSFTPYIPILSEVRAGIVAGVGAMQLGVAMGTPLPEIPAFAKGVANFIGGAALVGEQGPEIVNLPMGSSVVPNSGLSSFADTQNARAITADLVRAGSSDNRNQSSRVFNFNGDVISNDPRDFFAQMQQYLRENEGIA